MRPQLAAGAIVWRERRGTVEVLLVERTKHRDVSLPKGKLDPGETLPECAAREVREETGIVVSLGAPIGTSEYRLPTGQDKVVYYWLAEATREAVRASDFAPNGEVLALHWHAVADAKRACTYRHDVRLLDAFEERLAAGTARTFPMVAVRHAKAKDASRSVPDSDRQLTGRGSEQAAQIAGGLAAFGPRRIVTSTAARCRATMAPLEAATGIEATTSRGISQDDYAAHADAIERKVAKAIAARRGTVLCSHLPVIPSIVSAIVAASASPETPATHRASMLHSADFSVLHLASTDGRIVQVETHGAPV